MEIRKDPQTHRIIGAAMAVHCELGSGFLEEVYQEALAIEFHEREIPFSREVELTISYKGQPLQKSYRADFVCFGDIVVELKALHRLSGKEKSQVLNYLKATGFERGLLINFGTESLQYFRLMNNFERSKPKSF